MSAADNPLPLQTYEAFEHALGRFMLDHAHEAFIARHALWRVDPGPRPADMPADYPYAAIFIKEGLWQILSVAKVELPARTTPAMQAVWDAYQAKCAEVIDEEGHAWLSSSEIYRFREDLWIEFAKVMERGEG